MITGERIRDFVIYVLIGVGVVAFIMVLAFNRDFFHPEQIARWGGLVLYTPVIFGAVIQQHRQFWKQAAFWVTIAILLLLHIAAFSMLLQRVQEWRIVWYGLAGVFEGPAMMFVCGRAARKFPSTNI